MKLTAQGVKRTKVTRPNGTAFVSIENPDLARAVFPPGEGYQVTEIVGYDAAVDGRPAVEGKGMRTPIRQLTDDELEMAIDILTNGWGQAEALYRGTSYNDDAEDGGIVLELEQVRRLFTNEEDARRLGCRHDGCAVCHHRRCVYCPLCNSAEIDPDGIARFDDE